MMPGDVGAVPVVVVRRCAPLTKSTNCTTRCRPRDGRIRQIVVPRRHPESMTRRRSRPRRSTERLPDCSGPNRLRRPFQRARDRAIERQMLDGRMLTARAASAAFGTTRSIR